jgi:ferrous iron transport protein A
MVGRIVPLLNLQIGEEGRIVDIRGGFGFQRKLRTMGLREGKTVKMISIQPIRGPITISVGGCTITLGRGMAKRIFVEVGEK